MPDCGGHPQSQTQWAQGFGECAKATASTGNPGRVGHRDPVPDARTFVHPAVPRVEVLHAAHGLFPLAKAPTD